MKPTDLVLAVTITFIWGVNFSVIKMGVNEMDPFLLTGLRFTLTALPAVFFIPKPQVSMKILACYGLLFGIGVWVLMTLSIYAGLSAGMAGLILQSTAFISVLLGIIFLKESLSASQLIGIAVALSGLVFVSIIDDGTITLVGVLFALIAALSLSAAGLMIKKIKIDNMFSFVVWSSLFAPLPIFFLAFLFSKSGGLDDVTLALNPTSIFSIIFQAYVTTLFGYYAWNKLLKKYPLSLMAPINLLVSIFGLIGSIIFFNEAIGLYKSLAFALIIVGISLPFLSAANSVPVRFKNATE